MNGDIMLAFSEEIEQLLDENAIDIFKELQRQGIAVRREAQPTGDGSRDVVLILLASSVAVASCGWAITKIIDAISRGKRVMVRPLAASGNSDAAGAPLVMAEEVFQDQSRISASFGLKDGLRFELVSGRSS